MFTNQFVESKVHPHGIVLFEEVAILNVFKEHVGVAETETIPLGILTTILFPA